MFLVTGGAGFIGSVLVWELNNLGIRDIIVADNLGESSKWRNLVKRQYHDYIHRDQLIEKVRSGSLPWKLDAIIHLGACSSTTEKNGDFLMENNFHYSRDLCRYALDKDIRFINASSAATYGNGEAGFDTSTPLESLLPLNMYGYSKHLMDLWLKREGALGNVASLKFFNVYGPNEYHKGGMSSVALKLYREITESGQATLFASTQPGLEDGEQARDFVYVKDCVAVLGWLLANPSVNGILNVGSGQASTFNALAEAVFDALGKPKKIRYQPMPKHISKAYQNYTCASMDWPAKLSYPHKFHSLESGINDYISRHLANSDMYL